jgi:hypothetical protein
VGIEVYWHDREQTVLVWKICDTVTVADYLQASRISHKYHDSVTYDVTTVFDVRELRRIPENILRLFPIAAADVPNNQHIACALGVSSSLRPLINIFSRVYINVPLVESMDEVYALIHDHREQILKQPMGKGIT